MPRYAYWVAAFVTLISLVASHTNMALFHALITIYGFTLSIIISGAGQRAWRGEASRFGRLLSGGFAAIAALCLLRLPLYLGLPLTPELTALLIAALTAAKRIFLSGVLLILPVSAARDHGSVARAWLIYLGAVLVGLALVWGYSGPLAAHPELDSDTLGFAYQCVVTIASLCAVALTGVLGGSFGPSAHRGLVWTSLQVLIANVLFALAGSWWVPELLAHCLMLLSLLTVLASVIVPVMREREQAVHADLRATRDERDRLLARLVSSQEDERARLSREIHDGVGQPLTRLLALLSSARPAPSDATGELRALAADALAAVRSLARDLRPQVLDDIGLIAALRAYAERFERTCPIPGRLEVIGPEQTRLPQAVETAVFRAVTEALTNIAKHSSARRYGIVIDLRGPGLRVLVEDDGCGFDVTSTGRGLGLLGMAERMAQIGGTVDIESGLGAGTTILLRVPSTADAPSGSGCE